MENGNIMNIVSSFAVSNYPAGTAPYYSTAMTAAQQQAPANLGNSAGLAVFIVGGFAMKTKHLDKYKILYSELGVHHVELRSPTRVTMTIPRQCDRYARCLAHQLEQTERPIILHLFSGGVWIYYALNEFLSGAARRRIHAVVFESTPLDVKPEQFGRFAAWAAGFDYRPVWSYPFVLYRKLVGISSAWEARNRIRMFNLPQHLKVVFIYSKVDPVADPRYIEAYASQLHNRGIDVSTVVLSAARHCRAIHDQHSVYRETIAACVASLWQAPGASARVDLAPTEMP